jgi:flagellar protein FliO/FliZ
VRLPHSHFLTALFPCANLAAAGDVLYPRGTSGAAVDASSGIGAPSLLLAVAFAAAGAWLLWRGRRRSKGIAAKGRLSVAETRSLGNRQFLVVAAYGEKRFLIGVCAGQMSLLAPLDDAAQPPSP